MTSEVRRKMATLLTQSLTGAIAQEKSGRVPKGAHDDLAAKAGDAVRSMAKELGSPRLRCLESAKTTHDLDAIDSIAERYQANFDDVLILGLGGSSLGGKATAALADQGFGPPPGAPRLHFMENVDAATFRALFGRIDPAKTGVVAISKSGGTAETLMQLGVVMSMFDLHLSPGSMKERITVITEPKDSPLSRLADRYGLATLPHDEDIGGRFAVLSNVGMLPARLLGMNVRELRAGAAETLTETLNVKAPEKSAAAQGAALQVGAMRELGVSQSVLMVYSDRLASFTRWYRQLWAESLGKDGQGTTPIDALGAVDQHSQLQLYLAGQADKLYTIVRVTGETHGPAAPATILNDPEIGYLADTRMGALLDAEARATMETLQRQGRPVRTIDVAQLDETTLGALFMHFMLETVIAADLMGVNPFDQPAVEEGKQLARQYLSAAPGE
jgi:glucose-6-phosphate isomerase